MGLPLHAGPEYRQRARIGAGQQAGRDRGDRGGADGGDRGGVQDRGGHAGLAVEEGDGALVRVEAARGVVRDHADRLEREPRALVLLGAAPGWHQPHEAGGPGCRHDGPERHVRFASGSRRQHGGHGLGAGLRRERGRYVAVAENEYAHQATALSMSARSPALRGCWSASRTGARCCGRPGPITIWVTRLSESSQVSARPASEMPWSAAIVRSASRVSNVRLVTSVRYGSGRWVIRDPAGYGSPRRYLPVSQPPASGP